MITYVHMIHDSPLRLWGLSSHERLVRILTRLGDCRYADTLDALPTEAPVLLLRADVLYDARVIANMRDRQHTILTIRDCDTPTPVAAIVTVADTAPILDMLRTNRVDTVPSAMSTISLDDLSSGFQEQLRKFDPPYVLPITSHDQQTLEEHLFSGSYKGVTDLITKWAWPIPAKWATRACVRFGVVPNAVTTCSLVLTIIAGVCFTHGLFAPGLVAGWLMTFLDTVDGKLARVTVASSRFGHVLDHGLDIIHPPLWYIAWGMGLAAFAPEFSWPSLTETFGLILAGYIVGRLCEGLFQLSLGQFGMFCWRPFDSYNRLITARRNPNLLLLTGSLCAGRPDLGLVAVTAWTILSTALLLGRLLFAFGVRATSGPLRPWLADIGRSIDPQSFTARVFTRPPLTTMIHTKP